MQASRSATILLTVFFLSVSLISVLEIGHQVLHSIKNPFHNHSLIARKALSTPGLQHTLEQHGFKKVKFAPLMEQDDSTDNFIPLAFGFFDVVEEYHFSPAISDPTHNTHLRSSLIAGYSAPLTPPPLRLA